MFFRQVVAELRKVVWPTQQMVVTYFFVVLVFVIVMMSIIAGLDFAFGKAMFQIFGWPTRAPWLSAWSPTGTR